MAYQGRKFFTNETIEEKTRKYTRPYPIVTTQLLNMQHNSHLTWRNSINVGLPGSYLPPAYPTMYPTIPTQSPDSNRKRRHTESVEKSSVEGFSTKRKKTYEQGTQTKLSNLSEEIRTYWQKNQQTESALQRKLALRSALLKTIRKQFPTSSLHLVGSSCNGFAIDDSDADFCVMLTQLRQIDQRFEACMHLRSIQRLFQTIPSIKKLQFIKAKVPILKFYDCVSGCECDVNVNNATGIRNTHLLRTYSKLDERLSPMVVNVKRWAKSRNINDASQGTLSSYSLVLMVIHYFQIGCSPPIFNSLQNDFPNYFRGDSNVDDLPQFNPAALIPQNSSNKDEMGNFFLDSSSIISHSKPFDLTNTARSVYNYYKFQSIKAEIEMAYDHLEKHFTLQGLI